MKKIYLQFLCIRDINGIYLCLLLELRITVFYYLLSISISIFTILSKDKFVFIQNYSFLILEIFCNAFFKYSFFFIYIFII